MFSDIDLSQLKFFTGLTAAQQEILFPLFTRCNFAAGEVIFEQGEPAESMYLVVIGEVAVRFKPEDGPAIIAAKVKPDGMVGWSAALGREYYTSSVDCLENCTLLKVNRLELRKLCERDSVTCKIVLDRLAVVIAERLRNTHEHILGLLQLGICQETPNLVRVD